ncbi:2021_t:CDS:2 [Entrophospora sp. SA101]|nr:2021_t:CDS:2 [Entrophospora sp. SA101]
MRMWMREVGMILEETDIVMSRVWAWVFGPDNVVLEIVGVASASASQILDSTRRKVVY